MAGHQWQPRTYNARGCGTVAGEEARVNAVEGIVEERAGAHREGVGLLSWIQVWMWE